METRVAILMQAKGRRKMLERDFAKLEGITVVACQKDMKTGIKAVFRQRPDILLLYTDGPGFFPDELQVSLPRMLERLKKEKLFKTKVLLRTQYPEDHELIRSAFEAGVNIIDDKYDAPVIAEAMRRIQNGEHIRLYMRGHGSETFRSGRPERE